MRVRSSSNGIRQRPVTTWSEVEEDLRQLDGLNITAVVAAIDEDHYVGIGGGYDGLVCVFAWLGDQGNFNLINPDGSPDEGIDMNCGGQSIKIPLNRVLKLDQVIALLRTFSESGRVEPAERWVRD